MSGKKSAPPLPQVPPISQQELDFINQAGLSLNELRDLISEEKIGTQQTQSVLQNLSGLFNNGEVNEEAVNSLRDRIQGTLNQRQEIGQQALEFLGTFFDGAPDELSQAARSSLLRALEGDVSGSEGLKTTASRQFQVLKESAGRRGIVIEGDTLEDATSTSSAGARLLQNARESFTLAAQQENQFNLSGSLAALGTLDNIRLNNLNFAAGLANEASVADTSSLGFLTGALDVVRSSQSIPALGALSQGYMSLTAPFQNQRTAVFNRDTQNSLLQAQNRNSFFSGLGQLGGTAGTVLALNPATAPIGLGVLGGTAGLALLGQFGAF